MSTFMFDGIFIYVEGEACRCGASWTFRRFSNRFQPISTGQMQCPPVLEEVRSQKHVEEAGKWMAEY